MNHDRYIEPLESRIAPAGLVMATYDPVTKELTLTGDSADNVVDVFQTGPTTWRVEGKNDAALQNTSINVVGDERMEIGPVSKITVSMGNGNDTLDLINLRALKSLNVDMGGGADVLETSGILVKGNASISTGAGSDFVDLDGLSAGITGNLVVNDSGDGLVFNFGAAAVAIGGSVVFTGSAGLDILTMTTDTNLKIGRQLEFNSNGGLDRLELGSQGAISIGRDTQGRSVVYNGGAADDRLSIGSSKVTFLGSVEMNGAGGNDMLDIDGGLVSVGRSLAGVAVLLNGAGGADQIDLAGSSFTAAGSIRLDGGSEPDFLDITGLHRLVLKNGILMDGGTGTDRFEISADSLAITGGVQFNGGDDADTASLQGDGSVKGPVSLILGAATSGFQTADINSRSGLPSGLKISGGVTVDSSEAFATTLDTVKLTNLAIGGALSILTADGSSNIDIDNLTVAGTLNIDTRGGADIVEIERDATFGTSLFRKLATIMLGAGTDTLFIGKDSKNNRALFMANLTADGGSGSSDTRNDIEVDNKFAPPANYTETGFENLTLTPP